MAVPAKTTTWHGTPSEQRDLLAAVQHHCSCVYAQAARTSVCAGHRMLVEDQRALDGLLFVRRLADRLRHEEELVPRPLTGPATNTDLAVPSWPTRTGHGQGPDGPLEPSSFGSPFTPAELVRLATYRAAIKAGVYTDYCDEGGDAEARNHPIR